MKVVVGLGNPGSQYAGTRHNVGFDALDRLAARVGFVSGTGDFDRQARARFEALALDGLVSLNAGQEKALLLKPMTFMNLSGQSVQAALAFYQLQPGDLMVVLDDLALPCGRLRIRPGGSDGGHNGLKDIQRALGTSQYPRLRIGIDAPPPRIPGRDYVLGRFTTEQRKLLEPVLTRTAAALTTWMEQGIEAAMNKFNTDPDNLGQREP